jgi:DNA-binding MarR family transcriptional regulator
MLRESPNFCWDIFLAARPFRTGFKMNEPLWTLRNLTKMAAQLSSDQLVGILRDTVVSLVRRDGVDLSARQLGVFLTCYLNEGGHTVRGLAHDLNVSKPAITRALDRLTELDFVRRKVDPADRRSVLVQRTVKGAAFLRETRHIMTDALAANKTEAASRRVAS